MKKKDKEITSSTLQDATDDGLTYKQVHAIEFSTLVYDYSKKESCTLLEAITVIVYNYDIDLGNVKKLITARLLVDLEEELADSKLIVHESNINIF